MIGAVIIKHKLCLSDRETVTQIQESPYLQYFVGLPGYGARQGSCVCRSNADRSTGVGRAA